jgi:predicted phage tail protein
MRIECKSICKVKGAVQMTQITLHGILAKEFKKTFSLAIKRPKEVFDAISCSHGNFRNRVVELANQGIHFAVLVDGKKMTTMEELSIASDNQKIDIVPLVCGAGRVGAAIAIIALGVLTAGAGFAIGAGMGAAFFGSAAGFVSTTLTSVGVGLAMMGLQMALAPKPKMDRPSADVNSAKQSFIFSSKANVAEQGIPVPVGYGRLRVGSAVIQSTIKSYPQAFEKENSLASDGQIQTNDRLT